MSTKGKVSQLAVAVRMGQEPRQAISSVTSDLSPREISDLFRALSRHPVLADYVNGVLTPTKYAQLADIDKRPGVPRFKLIFHWSASMLRAQESKIRRFLEAERKLDAIVCRGAWDQALLELDTIERDVGVSLWSLNHRFCFLERAKGVTAQKHLLQELLDDSKATGLLQACASLFSRQVESTKSADSFFDDVNKYLRSRSQNPLYQYLAFHTAFFSAELPLTRLAEILDLEGANSIVDRYLTFVRIGHVLYADGRPAQLLRSYAGALRILVNSTSDDRLVWLFSAFAVDYRRHIEGIQSKVVRAFDEYTLGNYKQCISDIAALGDEADLSQDIVELGARAVARLESCGRQDSLQRVGHRIGALSELVVNEGSVAGRLAELKKEVACFSSSRRAGLLHAFVLRQTSAFTQEIPEKYQRFAGLSGSLSNPRQIASICRQAKGAWSTFYGSLDRSHTFALHTLANRERASEPLRELLTEIPVTRLSKYNGFLSFDREDYPAALMYFRSLTETGDEMDRLDGWEGMFISSLRLRDVIGASEVACKALIPIDRAHRRFPLGELCEAIERGLGTLPSEQMPVSVPNAVALYSHLRSPDRNYRLATITDDFLLSWGVERPTELRKIAKMFSAEQLQHFLSRACVTEVLDSHPYYRSQREVEDERVSVLQWLMESRPHEVARYADEIAQIERQQRVRDAMRSVEKSKVSVNVVGVRSELPQEARELFDRFRSLPKYPQLSMEELLRQLAKESRDDPVIKLARSERQEVLSQLFETVRHSFVFSNDFGLDAYLSVGIRHNTLAGRLRACYERARLVTQKHAAGQYSSNSYWEERAQARGIRSSDRQAVQKALAAFSQRLDALISVLRNAKIQVQGPAHPDGLLDFGLAQADVKSLENELSDVAEFEHAIDVIVNLLWQKTDLSLSAVRAVLKSWFRTEVDDALDALAQDVRDAIGVQLQELDAAITSARTSGHDEIDGVAAWFTRGDAQLAEDFDVWLAVDIANSMVNRCHAARSLEVTKHGSWTAHLPGRLLIGLVNTLFLVFDNVIKHGVNEGYRVVAQVEINDSAGCMRVEIVNRVSGTIDAQAVDSKLRSIRDQISSEVTSEKVRGEGGSGLVKIARLMKIDLGVAPRVEFALKPNHDFVTMLQFDYQGSKP